MAIKYNMREMNDLDGKGTKLYPKMFSAGVFETSELAKAIAQRCTLNEADIKGALSALSQVMSEQMANGHPVKLEGIGTFTAALSIKKSKERESGSGTKRNAQSIEIGSINFRPDKQLVKITNSNCQLVRTTQKFSQSQYKYTLEERMALAKNFIKKYGRMKIADYSQITGLTKSTATRELRNIAKSNEYGLQSAEKGPLLHYVWKEKQS